MQGSKQEGGQDGEQDDGDRKEKRKHVPLRNVVNYYFTNFPPEWNEPNLHEVFAKVGEIIDVYVARKMSKVGLRFGFFRVHNPQVLENRLNQIKIGSFKLRANVAKFERYYPMYGLRYKKVGRCEEFDNPSIPNQKPTTNLIRWLQNTTTVGESITIHSAINFSVFQYLMYGATSTFGWLKNATRS